ncbi:hypothetical protein PANT_8d00092 [Moesziomyces antarcticus T-34]|uniref:Uncharacterized protein n=1 Tax=Pseudozyma antarctica (strain T-34) TaxID=1151754 RepID=M9ME54_PSEA3|nr:hypothetical protein PANT_8d00092 [Moesziomyces antarcticus T-34]
MPVQWTSADGRTITINAKKHTTLPSSADIIEMCASKTLDKEVGHELVVLAFTIRSDAIEGLAAIAAQYKNSRNEKNTAQLRAMAAKLFLAQKLLAHFSERPRLLAEGKDLASALGPITVPQALNDRQRASKVSVGLSCFLWHTKMSEEDVAALFRLPPVDAQPVQETQGGSQPTASEAASPSSSPANQALSPRIQTPPLHDLAWRARVPQKTQRGPRFSQQDDGPSGSASAGPPTQTPLKRVAFSADNASASKRFRSSHEDNGSPEPDGRIPESFFEGRQPLLPDAQFRQAVSDVYTDFVTSYMAHLNANMASADVREMALGTLRDTLCNDMWRLLNFRGRSFTSVFGVFAEQRRGDVPPSSRVP